MPDPFQKSAAATMLKAPDGSSVSNPLASPSKEQNVGTMWQRLQDTRAKLEQMEGDNMTLRSEADALKADVSTGAQQQEALQQKLDQ